MRWNRSSLCCLASLRSSASWGDSLIRNREIHDLGEFCVAAIGFQAPIEFSRGGCGDTVIDLKLSTGRDMIHNERRILAKEEGRASVEFGRHIAGLLAEVEVVVVQLECDIDRSEEHTSELQSRRDLVCRLLL